MTKRDKATGRFMAGYSDPFRQGRTVDESTYRKSLETLEALNRAVAQAHSDVERMKAYERHSVR